MTTSAFALPGRLAAKADPTLIAADERQFAAIAHTLDTLIADLSDRLAAARLAPGRGGQHALDRDQEVHRLTARLRLLRRFGIDLCLGRMVRSDGEPVYIGRVGLAAADGSDRRLLVDWRSPAAEPFFGATRANPMGLSSRRRYRWAHGRITDYWDEAFTAEALTEAAALDDESAFIASLATSRSARMRDVLATIQVDQDAIIRADSRGALVVDGGPGTGKTVVALHRAAYLLYADPRLGHHRGDVLVVGPHRPYLAYVADVLPSLGEEGVQTCTLRDLVPEGAAVSEETDPRVAALKADARLVEAIEPAVRLSETPPTEPTVVETPWAELRLSVADWREAFGSVEPGMPHNQAREQVWDHLLAILTDKLNGADGVPPHALHRLLRQNRAVNDALNKAWPVLEYADVVADLWAVPAYLRLCAPWLGPDEVESLQRSDPAAWTVSDLPLLDAARQRIGDPQVGQRRRQLEQALVAQRDQMSDVIADLIAADDSELQVMSMLRGDDLRAALVDTSVVPAADPDLLAGPFAHVIVDEAQELTDAEWQMLLSRCPSRSFTIVGDRAQARGGFSESWVERLERVGFGRIEVASLGINYRTPREVMEPAERVIRTAVPDANVPTSVRSSGIPVRYDSTANLESIVAAWLSEHAEGVACVIGEPSFPATARVQSLSPASAKGLEFDLVVLVDPETFGDGTRGAVDRYVAMTRATQQLVVLTSG